MKHFILANIDNQDKAVKRNNENVKDAYEFFKKPSDEDDFEREIVEDILKDEKKLFQDVQNEPDRRQKIGDAITTADRFIDDDLFSDNDQQDILDFVDKIRSEIDTDDFLFAHEPIYTTPNVQEEPEPRFDFTDILFKENNKNERRTAKKSEGNA